MNIFTVSFFGHREINHIIDVEVRLEKIIRDLISQRGRNKSGGKA